MKLLQNVVNQKVNSITTAELLKYAKEYGMPLTPKQAEAIVLKVRGKKINIFDDQQRAQLVKSLSKIVGPKTAKDLNQLFLQFVK